MKVIVCGGQAFANVQALTVYLDKLYYIYRFDTVIHGNARGADQMAGTWARSRRLDEERYPADWETHGRSAGAIRNREMLFKGQPKIVIAFPGGRGTKNMCDQAKAAGVMVIDLRSGTVRSLIDAQYSALELGDRKRE